MSPPTPPPPGTRVCMTCRNANAFTSTTHDKTGPHTVYHYKCALSGHPVSGLQTPCSLFAPISPLPPPQRQPTVSSRIA